MIAEIIAQRQYEIYLQTGVHPADQHIPSNTMPTLQRMKSAFTLQKSHKVIEKRSAAELEKERNVRLDEFCSTVRVKDSKHFSNI